MAKGLSLLELAVVLLVLGLLAALALPRYLDFQAEARKAQRQETLRSLRSAYAIHLASYRTAPTWNQLKALMGSPPDLRLSSSCPSERSATVAYWDHNGNARCNPGERLAYLFADEACTVSLIAVDSSTVTVSIRCLKGHPDTVN
ncbi:prepilin-type N-terminal cleavage/methylation domain-containing protein [Thermus sp.]|uniref:prepilin-type N-terminal cleavage/methylation domain-containing protein n=1 Tax=Thermus sp. TaxID=275 RepID=UPI00307E244D